METNNRKNDSKETKAREQMIDSTDWLLQEFISMVNTGDMTIGITLNVGGLLVSGELIGGKSYFGGIGKDLMLSLGGPDKIRKSFEDWGRKIYSGGTNKKSGRDFKKPYFIHLKNARFYYPGQQPVPKNQGLWWRSRLEAIDGFSLGSLSVESE